MTTWVQNIVVDGLDCVLLLPEINWRVRPKITHAFFGAEVEGRTGIESRAPEAPGMLLSFEYFYTLKKTVAQEFRAALDALSPADNVAVPIWPDKQAAADYVAGKRKYTAQHYININPRTGAYAIDEDGGHPFTIGLAICALLERPKIVPKKDDEADFTLRLEEDSEWESRIDVNELATPTWDFIPNWATLPEETSHWLLERQRIGQGRRAGRNGLLGATKRTQTATYRFSSDEKIRKALTFWRDHSGPNAPFTITKALQPDGTVQTMQARFADEVVTLEFALDNTANARIAFREDLLLAGGQPSQSQPPRAFLYKVWWDQGTTVFAWTDWARSYDFNGVTYMPRVVEHKRSFETIRPGKTEWEMIVYDFDGNPLRAFGRLNRERRLLIEIYECNPLVANTAVQVFTGEFRGAPNTGEVYNAKLALLGGALTELVPQHFCEQGCNNTLGDDLCGIDIETLRVDGAIEAIADTTIDVTCASAAAADWFALGYAQLGAGDLLELRYIVRSEPIAGGQRITINRPLWNSVVGTSVSLYPGCDQQFAGGCAAHNNQAKYFGAPYKPEYIEAVSTGFKTKTGK